MCVHKPVEDSRPLPLANSPALEEAVVSAGCLRHKHKTSCVWVSGALCSFKMLLPKLTVGEAGQALPSSFCSTARHRFK